MGRQLGVDGQTGVLCAPGERFDAVLSADCEQFVLRIDAATVGSLTGDPRATLDPVLHVSDAALAAWRQQLMLVARSPELLERASANPRVASQLEHLLIDLLIEGHPPSVLQASHRDPAPGFVRRAQEFVNAHYAQPLQLADIVQAANVPERTLRDAFLQFRGMARCNTCARRGSTTRASCCAARYPTGGSPMSRSIAGLRTWGGSRSRIGKSSGNRRRTRSTGSGNVVAHARPPGACVTAEALARQRMTSRRPPRICQCLPKQTVSCDSKS